MAKVVLQVHATLEIDPDELQFIDRMELENLQSCVFEICDTVAPVSFSVGDRRVRGEVRFVSPNPYDLKVAKLKSLVE